MKLRLDKVTLRHGDAAPLLAEVNLSLDPGDFVLIEGPSGCGKSSLLRLLNRLQEPASGQLLVDGEAVIESATPAFRRRSAYLQQTPVMLDGSVRDNLLLPFRIASTRRSLPSDQTLRQWLDRFLLQAVKLEDVAPHLSVGQQQRLALIRLLLTEPELLLCDEPTSALDDDSRRIVLEALQQANLETGMAIVLVSHDGLVLDKVQPRRLRIVDGHLEEA